MVLDITFHIEICNIGPGEIQGESECRCVNNRALHSSRSESKYRLWERNPEAQHDVHDALAKIRRRLEGEEDGIPVDPGDVCLTAVTTAVSTAGKSLSHLTRTEVKRPSSLFVVRCSLC